MDNSSIVIALIAVGAAIVSSTPGILAYFNQKKVSSSDATQKITDAAVKLVEPLQARIEVLEKENVILREKIEIATIFNEYVKELEMSKQTLEEQIALLSGKLEKQIRMIQTLISAMRGFINSNTEDQREVMEKLLDDMEKQVEKSIGDN